MNRNPVIGVIGGMGPLATVEFQRLLVEATAASSDQGNIEVIVHNNPNIPDRTRSLALDGGDSFARAIIASGRKLAHAGATVLVMPCVTAHARFDLIAHSLPVPLIDMVRLTAHEVVAQGIPHPVGVLATDGTNGEGFVVGAFKEAGIETLIPDPPHQSEVMRAAYAVKSSHPRRSSGIIRAAQYLKTRGAESLLLGCTELSFYEPELRKVLPTIEPMRVAAAYVAGLCSHPGSFLGHHL